MSMSEFEEQPDSGEERAASLPTEGQLHPEDFSDEDVAFAKELAVLFALDAEELPPYFVQTLLDAENPRFQPVEHGLEHKTRAHVFRRLKLRRRLFNLHRPPMASFFTLLPARSSLIVGAALLLCMFLTVLFTAPSFATGMTILLSGAKTGVKLVQSYPAGVRSSHVGKYEGEGNSPPKVSLPVALQQLHGWTMYWPQAIPSTYALDDTYLYRGQQQDWVDGPFIELDYSLAGVIPHGTGLLAIREFKLQPDVNVLQVVKDGAAESIKIDQNAGAPQAIYVDGQWVVRNKFFHVWVYGQRSELIYQKDGIVFWIVGDQRDGMGKEALLKIAESLQPFHLSRYMYPGNDYGGGSVTLLRGDVDGPFTGDLLAIFPDDNGSSTYLSLGSTEQSTSGTSAPTPKSRGAHGH